jgi:hypothetical protein
VIEAVAANFSARLTPVDADSYRIAATGGRALTVTDTLVRLLASRGLIEDVGGAFRATPAAAAFLKRETSKESPFRMQHGSIVPATRGDVHREALEDLDESPVGKLARRKGADGAAFLPEHAVAAAERLRRDFELGQLQPRITANWSASINTGRRASDGREANISDTALAARLRFDRAMRAVGPDLADVLVDVCCFLKGLETVERERRWPARSAKLVLKIALESLSRHYGLSPEASGRAGSAGLRHWGAEGFRPEIT